MVWLDDPEEHDYPAAQDYLELHFDPATARKLASNLKKAKTQTKKAKDILRASGLALLPPSNGHVAHNVDKVKAGKALSPILLVRDYPRLIVADGYHRLCAVYYLSEDLTVPCRIANLSE
jgi:hypothetical protein